MQDSYKMLTVILFCCENYGMFAGATLRCIICITCNLPVKCQFFYFSRDSKYTLAPSLFSSPRPLPSSSPFSPVQGRLPLNAELPAGFQASAKWGSAGRILREASDTAYIMT